MSLLMFDVSSNNHPGNVAIDYKKAKKGGYSGVIIKCTEGTDYTNPWLRNDAISANAAGLHVGFYHFAHPSKSSASDQANYALRAIKNLPRDIGLTLDLELQEGMSWTDLATWAKFFLETVSMQKVGAPIYLNDNFLSNLPDAPFGHKLWLASPGHTPRRTVWMWQKSWTGVVPGVPGECDIDQFYG